MTAQKGLELTTNDAMTVTHHEVEVKRPDPIPPDRLRKLELLSDLLGIGPRVVSVIKEGDVGGVFKLVLDNDLCIVLGDARKLCSLAACRAAFADCTGIMIRELTNEMWRIGPARLILELAVIQPNPSDLPTQSEPC